MSEHRIRVLYARILRIRVCQYAHIRAYMCVYTRVYMSLCYSFQQASLLDKQNKRQVSTRNLHIEKTSMKVRVFDRFASSPTNYRLLIFT